MNQRTSAPVMSMSCPLTRSHRIQMALNMELRFDQSRLTSRPLPSDANKSLTSAEKCQTRLGTAILVGSQIGKTPLQSAIFSDISQILVVFGDLEVHWRVTTKTQILVGWSRLAAPCVSTSPTPNSTRNWQFSNSERQQIGQ